MSGIFNRDADAVDERSSGAFVWFLPVLWFGASVLLEWLLTLFASSNGTAVASLIVFTALMVVGLIITLNSDNVGGAGKVFYLLYSVLGWMFGTVALMVLGAVFNHQAVT